MAARATWPQITTIGTESAMQSRTGVTVLVAPGPGGHQAHPDPAAGARVAGRHEARALLVRRHDQRDLRAAGAAPPARCRGRPRRRSAGWRRRCSRRWPSTPSSASTCMIMRAPLMRWPASGCARAVRGWITVSLMRRLFDARGIDEPSSLARRCKLRADPLFCLSTAPAPRCIPRVHASHHRHPAAERGRRADAAWPACSPPAATTSSRSRSRPTDDPTVSRLTLVTSGSDAVIQQIANQLNKLVDVVSVEDMTRGEHLERELVLLKLRVDPASTPTRCAATWCAPAAGCSIRRVDGFIVELHRERGGDQQLHRAISRAARRAPRGGAQRRARHQPQRAPAARAAVRPATAGPEPPAEG